jgi:hypothetical protein
MRVSKMVEIDNEMMAGISRTFEALFTKEELADILTTYAWQFHDGNIYEISTIMAKMRVELDEE